MHTTRAPVSAENSSVGDAWLLGSSGAASILTSGAIVSIVQAWRAVPVLPAASVAVTWKLCRPSASGPTCCGEPHGVDGDAVEAARHARARRSRELERRRCLVARVLGRDVDRHIGRRGVDGPRVGGGGAVAGGVGRGDLERVRGRRRAARPVAASAHGSTASAVERARHARAGLGRELERRRRLVARVLRARRRSSTAGAVVSIVQLWLARAGVAGGVARADLERVRAVGERPDLLRRRARGDRQAVDAAFDERACLGGELERRRGLVAGVGGRGVEPDDGRGRCRRSRRGGRCRCCRRRRSRLTSKAVPAVGRAGRAAAARPHGSNGDAVEAALDARAGLGGEGEAGPRVVAGVGGSRVDR